MRTSFNLCLLPVVLLLSAASLSPDERRSKLDSGENLIETREVPGLPLPEVILQAVIDAPPERVWDIISHCADFKRTLHRIKESKELERNGDHVRCETVFDSPWPLPPLRAVVGATHSVEGGRWVREWKLESGDYNYNEGRWTLTLWSPGRTLLEYRARSQPKVDVPVFMQRMGLTKELPLMVEKLRESSAAAK